VAGERSIDDPDKEAIVRDADIAVRVSATADPAAVRAARLGLLLRSLGVPVDEETGVPAHDPDTMETPVPGVFVAGVLAAGLDIAVLVGLVQVAGWHALPAATVRTGARARR
jgi:hypothetical protein